MSVSIVHIYMCCIIKAVFRTEWGGDFGYFTSELKTNIKLKLIYIFAPSIILIKNGICDTTDVREIDCNIIIQSIIS